MSEIINLIHKPLSDEDIHKILGYKCKIIKYSELSNYRDLDDLMPNIIDCVVILYEESSNSGHWVGLMKYNNAFDFFDPYGLKVDKELLWIDLKMRKSLDQYTPYLTNLLKNEKYIYNKVKYQSNDDYANTCGFHVCHRIYRLFNDSLSLEGYHEYMHDIKTSHKVNYDVIVAIFIQMKLE